MPATAVLSPNYSTGIIIKLNEDDAFLQSVHNLMSMLNQKELRPQHTVSHLHSPRPVP